MGNPCGNIGFYTNVLVAGEHLYDFVCCHCSLITLRSHDCRKSFWRRPFSSFVYFMHSNTSRAEISCVNMSELGFSNMSFGCMQWFGKTLPNAWMRVPVQFQRQVNSPRFPYPAMSLVYILCPCQSCRAFLMACGHVCKFCFSVLASIVHVFVFRVIVAIVCAGALGAMRAETHVVWAK